MACTEPGPYSKKACKHHQNGTEKARASTSHKALTSERAVRYTYADCSPKEQPYERSRPLNPRCHRPRTFSAMQATVGSLFIPITLNSRLPHDRREESVPLCMRRSPAAGWTATELDSHRYVASWTTNQLTYRRLGSTGCFPRLLTIPGLGLRPRPVQSTASEYIQYRLAAYTFGAVCLQITLLLLLLCLAGALAPSQPIFLRSRLLLAGKEKLWVAYFTNWAILLHLHVSAISASTVNKMEIQWNPSNMNTIGTEGSVLIKKVSSFQGLNIYACNPSLV